MISKQEIRRSQLAVRRMTPQPAASSEQLWRYLFKQPFYAAARSVLYYISVRSEVGTQLGIEHGWLTEKRVAVPYCEGELLKLFWLRDWNELHVGSFQVPEPKASLRAISDRKVEPHELDLLFVPGVAFDSEGRRLGYGRGYFDRLLSRTTRDALRVGLAFESQIVPHVPTESHDIPMSLVVTEQATYRSGQRIPHSDEGSALPSVEPSPP